MSVLGQMSQLATELTGRIQGHVNVQPIVDGNGGMPIGVIGEVGP